MWLCERAWRAAGLLTLGLAGPAARAAEPPPPTVEESIDVRVVNVETVVTDAKGKRVRDLKAEDFRLLVDGKEVPVGYFTEVVDGQTAAGGPAAPLPPDEPAAVSRTSPTASRPRCRPRACSSSAARRTPQKLAFTVRDAGQGGSLWGAAEFRP